MPLINLVNEPIEDYIARHAAVIRNDPPPLWDDFDPVKTWKIIARLLGRGLALGGYTEKEIQKHLSELWTFLCIAHVSTGKTMPPFDNRDMVKWIKEAYEKQRAELEV